MSTGQIFPVKALKAPLMVSFSCILHTKLQRLNYLWRPRVTVVGIVTWVVQIWPHPTPLALKRSNQGSRWCTFRCWTLLLHTRLCLFQQSWFPVVLSYTHTLRDNWPGWNLLPKTPQLLWAVLCSGPVNDIRAQGCFRCRWLPSKLLEPPLQPGFIQDATISVFNSSQF